MTSPHTESHSYPGNGDARLRSPEQLQADIERHRANIDETLTALQHKFSPGELLDLGLHQVKDGSGEFFGNLAHSVKQNPLPLALTGIGLAWLMYGQNRSDRNPPRSEAQEPFDEQSQSAPGDTQHTRESTQADTADLYAYYLAQEYPFEEEELDCILYEDLGPEVYEDYQRGPGDAMRERAAHLKEASKDAIGRAGEKTGEWSEQTREQIAAMRDKTRERITRIRARMNKAGQESRERIARARDLAWRRARRQRAAAKAQVQHTARQVGGFFDRNPLSLVALGVVAGAALGTTLPETRREQRLMGETSDRLKRQARETLHEKTQQTKETVAAARDAAVDEAQAQGLSAQGVRQEGEALREKVSKVAQAAGDEAQDQGLTAEGAREEVHEAREKIERVAGAAGEAAKREAARDKS